VAGSWFKPVVDCLCALLGGSAGVAEDYRITKLTTEKGLEELKGSSVAIRVDAAV